MMQARPHRWAVVLRPKRGQPMHYGSYFSKELAYSKAKEAEPFASEQNWSVEVQRYVAHGDADVVLQPEGWLS